MTVKITGRKKAGRKPKAVNRPYTVVYNLSYSDYDMSSVEHVLGLNWVDAVMNLAAQIGVDKDDLIVHAVFKGHLMTEDSRTELTYTTRRTT